MKKIILNSYKILIKSGISNKHILLVLFSSFITLIFEIIGFGIFIPIVNALISGANEISLVSITYKIPYQDKEHLIGIVSIFIIIIFLIKSLTSLLNAYLISNFWQRVNSLVSDRIFKNILDMDYNEFGLKSNSSYSNLIVLEVEKFSELISFLITLILEILILFSIIIILLIYDFKSSMFIIFLLIFSVSLLYFPFKKKLVNWGLYRQNAQDKYQNDIKSGLLSHLSIKINGGINYFLNNSRVSLKDRNFFMGRQKFYSNIPRTFLEFSGILIIVLTGFFLFIFLNQTLEYVISYLIIIIVSFTRILPSYNRILTSINQLNFYESIIELIKNYLILEKNEVINTIELKEFNEVIQLKNVTFKYPDSKYNFGPITLDIKKGEIIGVFGKSGSGKSTLIKLIMGVLSPLKGQILIDKKNYELLNINSLSNLFGYIEQNVKLFNASLMENIILKNKERCDLIWFQKIIELCNLNEVYERYEHTLITEDGTNLSGGQIQRIGLARALYKKPKIIVLDEFTSALDQKNKIKIINSLLKIKDKLDFTVILISHDNYLKKICDKVVNI